MLDDLTMAAEESVVAEGEVGFRHGVRPRPSLPSHLAVLDSFPGIQLAGRVPCAYEEVLSSVPIRREDGPWGWLDGNATDIVAVQFVKIDSDERADVFAACTKQEGDEMILKSVSILFLQRLIVVL